MESEGVARRALLFVLVVLGMLSLLMLSLWVIEHFGWEPIWHAVNRRSHEATQ